MAEKTKFLLSITTQNGMTYCQIIKDTSEEKMRELVDYLTESTVGRYIMENGWIGDVFDSNVSRIYFQRSVLQNSIIYYRGID